MLLIGAIDDTNRSIALLDSALQHQTLLRPPVPRPTHPVRQLLLHHYLQHTNPDMISVAEHHQCRRPPAQPLPGDGN